MHQFSAERKSEYGGVTKGLRYFLPPSEFSPFVYGKTIIVLTPFAVRRISRAAPQPGILPKKVGGHLLLRELLFVSRLLINRGELRHGTSRLINYVLDECVPSLSGSEFKGLASFLLGLRGLDVSENRLFFRTLRAPYGEYTERTLSCNI